MSFETTGYLLVERAISTNMLKFIQIQFDMIEKCYAYMFNENKMPFFNDDSADKDNTFELYAPFVSETVSLMVQPNMEQFTGKKLFPTYSYMRAYYPLSKLKKHKDRKSCEISATICIDSDPDYPWEIFFKNDQDETVSLGLKPGDLAIYKGCDLLHWRKEYHGKRHVQMFLHYVDANGPNASNKYDFREMLGLPGIKTFKY